MSTLIAKNNTSFSAGIQLPSVYTSVYRDVIINKYKPVFWVEAHPSYIQKNADGSFASVVSLNDGRKLTPVIAANRPIIGGTGNKTFLQFGFGGLLTKGANGAIRNPDLFQYASATKNFIKAFVFKLDNLATKGGTILGSANGGGSYWASIFNDTLATAQFRELVQGNTTSSVGDFSGAATWHSLVVSSGDAGYKIFIDEVQVSAPAGNTNTPTVGGSQYEMVLGGVWNPTTSAVDFPFLGSIKAAIYSQSDIYTNATTQADWLNYLGELRTLMNS